ncbi:hypothetical protein D187_006331 [Cystobacter fuscus DSM 2262]|uniref:Uncharacterized protein n=1 Tax=Cystobacter fuscus (strain ATCC 25194 / DSM 2262 / NBRC 100088 / M29) TaxID=1242864 RepID=S9PIK1_CYSF2|nr:hypothetical protein D187_006331 [Cystobacter fuscus DSM 2262]
MGPGHVLVLAPVRPGALQAWSPRPCRSTRAPPPRSRAGSSRAACPTPPARPPRRRTPRPPRRRRRPPRGGAVRQSMRERDGPTWVLEASSTSTSRGPVSSRMWAKYGGAPPGCWARTVASSRS